MAGAGAGAPAPASPCAPPPVPARPAPPPLPPLPLAISAANRPSDSSSLPRHSSHQLVAQHAGRHVGEHGSQLSEHPVTALGAAQLAPLEDSLHVEDDERRRLLDARAEGVGTVSLDQVGWIGAFRQRYHAELELTPGGQPGGAEHRVLTRSVGVETELEHRDDPLSSPTCSSVSAVPMIPTALRSPAWWSASTSV